MHAVIISRIASLSHPYAGPRMTAHLAWSTKKCSLNLLPGPLLHFTEVSFLLFHGLTYTLHKGRPLRIYTMSQVISHIIIMAINPEINRDCVSLHVLWEDGWSVQHIYIVATSRHAKECMPNPQVIGGHSLQNHGRWFPPSSEHALPCRGTVTPLVHTINATELSRESLPLPFSKQLSYIRLIRSTKVVCSKCVDYRSTEITQRLYSRWLPDAYVLVHGISWETVSKDTNRGNTLLQWSQS